MEEPNVVNLEVGQLAETRTFEHGFRGAWFRCKIRDISPEKGKIKPEYFDFPDEEIIWTKVFQVPPYGRKSKHIKKQLMVRPQYPIIYRKSEMNPEALNSQVCVIVDGTWTIGDWVDWYEEDCYWSARVTKVLSDDKVKIELPMAPIGEGGTYEAFCKDLRPSLDWSPTKGWTLHTVEGETSCSGAQLFFPSKQEISGSSPLHASSSSRGSVNPLAVPFEGEEEAKMEDESVTGKPASSSDSISTLHVVEETDTDSLINVNNNNNMMLEDTLEAPIMDLEELANKLKWMKSILQTTNQSPSSWKFLEHRSN